MNEIEKMFYDAWVDNECEELIKPGAVIGIYRVDFLIKGRVVVEIDGHEHHKTKEQRLRDYQRERYLTLSGFLVIRFMGTEVFNDANRCAREAQLLSDFIIADGIQIDLIEHRMEHAEEYSDIAEQIKGDIAMLKNYDFQRLHILLDSYINNRI